MYGIVIVLAVRRKNHREHKSNWTDFASNQFNHREEQEPVAVLDFLFRNTWPSFGFFSEFINRPHTNTNTHKQKMSWLDAMVGIMHTSRSSTFVYVQTAQ